MAPADQPEPTVTVSVRMLANLVVGARPGLQHLQAAHLVNVASAIAQAEIDMTRAMTAPPTEPEKA